MEQNGTRKKIHFNKIKIYSGTSKILRNLIPSKLITEKAVYPQGEQKVAFTVK